MKNLLHLFLSLLVITMIGCRREPPLHLYEAGDVDINLPDLEVGLETYWDYELVYDVKYEWKAEWFYGWDATDVKIFGQVEYDEPTAFLMLRYYTGQIPYGPHTNEDMKEVETRYFQDKFAWGFWDMLVWSKIVPRDGSDVDNINIDKTSMDSVIAYTNPSMTASRYQAPKYTRSFYEPEQLFTAYEQAIDINENLDGFEFDEARNIWIKRLNMVLRPVTYIYLTQVILRHNNGRVDRVLDGTANLSGMARTMNMNLGKGGSDAVTVEYKIAFKEGCTYKNNELVDIVGGRVLTFGICDLAVNQVKTAADVKDVHKHYMDVKLQFNNGMDSTFVFDVTDQVRKRFKGGVLTVVLDMDTVPTPLRKGGSAFDAVVEEFQDGGTHEFEM